MKSKEEIFEALAEKGSYFPPVYDGNECPIFEAMEQYAKQIALSFTEWVDANGYTLASENSWESYNDMSGKTLEQLYEKFMEK